MQRDEIPEMSIQIPFLTQRIREKHAVTMLKKKQN